MNSFVLYSGILILIMVADNGRSSHQHTNTLHVTQTGMGGPRGPGGPMGMGMGMPRPGPGMPMGRPNMPHQGVGGGSLALGGGEREGHCYGPALLIHGRLVHWWDQLMDVGTVLLQAVPTPGVQQSLLRPRFHISEGTHGGVRRRLTANANCHVPAAG